MRQLWQERNDFRDSDHQGDQRQKCHAEWQDAYENPKERHVTCKISDDEYIDPKRWRDQGQFDDNHHENTESNRIEAHVRDDREEDVHREDDHGHGIEESTQKDVDHNDIAADRRTHVVFDRLHGAADGAAFSKELSQAVMEHHGMAGPALVEEILADKSAALDAFRTVMNRFRSQADARCAGSAQGILGRGRDRFAAIAAAGEFAAANGITGWPEGAAFAAALEVFVDWHASLGPDPATLTRHREEAAAEASVERLRRVLSSNRDRIADLDGWVDAYPDAPVAWHRRGCYFISAQMWQEIYGIEYRDAARHCQARGFLIPGDGANILSKAPAGITGMSRAYRIRSDILP